jgi:hypothetical protein
MERYMYAILLVGLGWSSWAWGESPRQIGLWLDVREIDLSQAAVREQLLQAAVDVYVLPVLLGGQTLFASQRTEFMQMERYRHVPEILSDWLAQAQARQRRVYVYWDCWQWGDGRTPEKENLLVRHGDWAARDIKGQSSCTLPLSEKDYASFVHPQVQEQLRGLVRELGKRYRQVDGWVLKYRYPAGGRLLYHEKARAAYIRLRQIDPIDLIGHHTGEVWQEWLRWNLAQAEGLLRELVGEYRRQVPGLRVAVRGRSGLYEFSGSRDGVEDWLRWLQTGLVDEVYMEGDWPGKGSEQLYEGSRQMVEKIGKGPVLGVWLQMGRGKALEVVKRWEALAQMGAQEVILEARDMLDLAKALEVAGRWRGQVSGNYWEDERLQVRVTVRLPPRPRLREVLALLSEQAQVPLTWGGASGEEDKWLPVTWEFRCPAWQAMQTVASWPGLRGGRWEKAGAGWRLCGELVAWEDRPWPGGGEPSGQEEEVGEQRGLWFVGGVLGILVLLAGGWYAWRRRRRA